MHNRQTQAGEAFIGRVDAAFSRKRARDGTESLLATRSSEAINSSFIGYPLPSSVGSGFTAQLRAAAASKCRAIVAHGGALATCSMHPQLPHMDGVRNKRGSTSLLAASPTYTPPELLRFLALRRPQDEAAKVKKWRHSETFVSTKK